MVTATWSSIIFFIDWPIDTVILGTEQQVKGSNPTLKIINIHLFYL